jgi:metal-responsive CopG/Arc/MetJ family transcriptional regulator
MRKRIILDVEENFLNEFEEVVRKAGYISRNEAIREAMRAFLKSLRGK